MLRILSVTARNLTCRNKEKMSKQMYGKQLVQNS